jgi:thioesterase domain-containing protein
LRPAELPQFVIARVKKARLKLKRKLLWKKNEFQINYARATGRELPKDVQRNHKAIERALQSYVPQPYYGRIVLFRASTQPPSIVPDANLGWSALAVGGIEVIESPGTHGAMTVDPYAESLATQLEPFLSAALEEPAAGMHYAAAAVA